MRALARTGATAIALGLEPVELIVLTRRTVGACENRRETEIDALIWHNVANGIGAIGVVTQGIGEVVRNFDERSAVEPDSARPDRARIHARNVARAANARTRQKSKRLIVSRIGKSVKIRIRIDQIARAVLRRRLRRAADEGVGEGKINPIFAEVKVTWHAYGACQTCEFVWCLQAEFHAERAAVVAEWTVYAWSKWIHWTRFRWLTRCY